MICYGRSVPSIADQLYGKDDSLTQEQKTEKAQKVYDGVLNAFSNLRSFIISSEKFVKEHGYVETILGRRRHIPEMLLPEFEFYPKDDYVNPYIDPLDPDTLLQSNTIPYEMREALLRELMSCKYYGQIVKKTKELDKQHIKVVNNRHKITEASRQVQNSIIQGCLGPDVMIKTKAHGDEKISNVASSNCSVTIWDGEQWSSGLVVPSGKKQKCVIRFKDGNSLICSPDHKFLCVDINNDRQFISCQEMSKLKSVSVVSEKHKQGYVCVDYIDITDEYIYMYDVCNTDNGVFVADGLITHNSAADQTKLAMLVLFNNEDWKRIGGRLLVPVHDELIAEVPMEYAEEGGKILSSCMIQAANFLPFDSKCDVTTTLRWYGLEYPCKYKKPDRIDTQDPEEIKWIQYQLVEMEYILPVIVEGDEKARGDASLGINGKISDDYYKAIDDYIGTRSITKDNFIETIEHEVLYSEVKR